MNIEKVLPYIFALLLPGLALISTSSSFLEELTISEFILRYALISIFLIGLWKSNEYVIYRDRFSIGIKKAGLLLIFNVSIILLFILINNFLLQHDLYTTSLLPEWLIPVRFGLASVLIIFIIQAFKTQKERASLIRENAALQSENLKSQLETLKQQINPHFLFNSLNTLIDLIEDDQDRAVDFVRQFSSIYRYVLQSSRHDFIQLKDEIDFLHEYWSLLKTRFKHSIHLHIDISESSKMKLIPPLSLQLLIENAVKHNEISEKKPLRINIKECDSRIVVTNNIQLKKYETGHSGLGLSNLQQRFKFLMAHHITYGVEEDLFKVILPLK